MESFVQRDASRLWKDVGMRALFAGTLVVLALVVAGCGGGGSPSKGGSNNGEASKSAKQITLDSVKAAESATFMRINGNVTCSGQPVGLDAFISKNGDGAKAALTIGGKPVQLVVSGKDGYVAAEPTVWSQFPGVNGAAIGQFLDGRPLKFPVNNAKFAELVACAGPSALFAQLKADAGSATNKGETKYNGQSVVAVDGTNGTLYVATSGNPYPVALVKKGKGGGTIKFSAWNQPFSVPVPTNAVDLSQVPS
jgi:hypothetical protein